MIETRGKRLRRLAVPIASKAVPKKKASRTVDTAPPLLRGPADQAPSPPQVEGLVLRGDAAQRQIARNREAAMRRGRARIASISVASEDYRGEARRIYTADVNYKGGPDQAATAVYLRHIPLSLRGKGVVDIGCAEGMLANEVLARRDPHALVGIDINTEFILDAKRHATGVAVFQKDDMHRMRIASGTVDLALSRFSFHYSADLPGLFEEVARILKPGGELLFLTNMTRGKNGGALPERLKDSPWIKVRLSERQVVNNRAQTEEEYTEALARAGFELLEVERFDASHKIDSSDPHHGRIEMHAVIMRARKRAE
jgi:SAM-dependent methyltransferase